MLICIHCTLHISFPFLREFSKVGETRPLGCRNASPLRPKPHPIPTFSLPLCQPSSPPVSFLLSSLRCLWYHPHPVAWIFWHDIHLFFLSVVLLLMPWVLLLCPTSNFCYRYFALFSLLSSIIHAHAHKVNTPIQQSRKVFPSTFCSYSVFLYSMQDFNENCGHPLPSPFQILR